MPAHTLQFCICIHHFLLEAYLSQMHAVVMAQFFPSMWLEIKGLNEIMRGCDYVHSALLTPLTAVRVIMASDKVDGFQITNATLSRAIAKKLNCSMEDIFIEQFSTSAGSNKGENFTCVLFAVEVHAKIKDKLEMFHFMAKCLPANEGRAKFITELQGFEKECLIYGDLMGRYQKMRAEAGLPQLQVPICYLADNASGIIIMENLKTQGYKMSDKLAGQDLTIDIAENLLSQLAAFHATGVHFVTTYEKDGLSGLEAFNADFPFMSFPGWLPSISEEWKTKNDDSVKDHIGIVKNIIEEACLDAPDREELVAKIDAIMPSVVELVKDQLAPHLHHFNTLLHNDVHMNNVMYKLADDGRIESLKLLDLQMIKYARPTVDLAYFFGSSSTVEFRSKHLEQLLSFYHQKLISDLEKFGYSSSIYELDALKQDLDDCWMFLFSSGCMHVQMENGNVAADFDMDEFAKDDESYDKAMQHWAQQQIERAKENKPFLRKVLDIVREAASKNVI